MLKDLGMHLGRSATGSRNKPGRKPAIPKCCFTRPSRSQLIVEESETGLELLSGYPLPARQEPEIATVLFTSPIPII